MQVDYLIIGQGLAGSILANEALRRGMQVAVIDDPASGMATRVAGGLINPITGPRLVLTEHADLFIPYAKDFYRGLPDSSSSIRDCSIYKIFGSDEDVSTYEKRLKQACYKGYLGHRLSSNDVPTNICAPYGGVLIQQGMALRPADVLEALYKNIENKVARFESQFAHNDLFVSHEHVTWKSVTADCAVFCEGFAVQSNPWFQSVEFSHAKGERLLIRSPDLQLHTPLVSHGLHLLPLGNDLYWVGGTYAWNDLHATPTYKGKNQILERLRTLVSATFEVLNHAAGIRPITLRRTPVLGCLADNPRLAIFNGLGPKGFLRAPYYANHLLDHLIKDSPLHKDVELRTHQKQKKREIHKTKTENRNDLL